MEPVGFSFGTSIELQRAYKGIINLPNNKQLTRSSLKNDPISKNYNILVYFLRLTNVRNTREFVVYGLLQMFIALSNGSVKK